LQPEKTAGKAFNVADVDYPVNWEMIWAGVASYCGLPSEGLVKGGERLSGGNWQIRGMGEME
jgi:hypothetical protein